MSYTFIGVATDASSTTTSTATFNIGATSGPYVVIGIHQQNGHASPTCSIGGVSLNLDVIDGNSQNVIFSGIATGLSGSQTVSLTAAGSAFETRGYSCWTTTDPVSLSHTASSTTGTSFPIVVKANDFLFVMGHDPGTATYDYSPSTQAPNANRTIGAGTNNASSADWVISASNNSFSIAVSAATTFIAAAATYAQAAAPAASVSVLRRRELTLTYEGY